MTVNDKKKIAALTGVIFHVQQEQQLAAQALPTGPQVVYPGPWALQGRQTIMNMRSLAQRRVLKR